MKLKLLIVALMIMVTKYGTAQIIDKYGFNFGLTYANQLWDYKLLSIDNSNKDYKIGFSAFFVAEKKIKNVFSVRQQIGYIQKGFKNNIELTFSDGTSAGVDKQNVIFHDLAANIGLKIAPLNKRFSPYIAIGFQGDYLISYKDVVFEEQNSGEKFNLYKSQIDMFKKINLGGVIGIGFDLNDLVYTEIDYNPSITNSFNDKGLRIKDNCWVFNVGFNINKEKTK